MTDEEKKVLEEGPEPVSAWPGGCPHGLDTCPDAGEKSPLGKVSCRRPAGEPCSVDEMAEARIAQMEKEIADEIAPGLLKWIDSSYEVACGLYDVHKIAARQLDAWVNGVRNDKQLVRDMGDCLVELFDRVSRLAGEIRESRYAFENTIGIWETRKRRLEEGDDNG